VSLTGNITLGIGVLSYSGQLNFTVVADRNGSSDLPVFLAGLQHALTELTGRSRSPPSAHSRRDPARTSAGGRGASCGAAGPRTVVPRTLSIVGDRVMNYVIEPRSDGGITRLPTVDPPEVAKPAAVQTSGSVHHARWRECRCRDTSNGPGAVGRPQCAGPCTQMIYVGATANRRATSYPAAYPRWRSRRTATAMNSASTASDTILLGSHQFFGSPWQPDGLLRQIDSDRQAGDHDAENPTPTGVARDANSGQDSSAEVDGQSYLQQNPSGAARLSASFRRAAAVTLACDTASRSRYAVAGTASPGLCVGGAKS
jgi:hypothetical protein